MPASQRVVAVVGPTASGKSSLAVELAHGSAPPRSSTPTRCSCTAAWTSAPPSPRSPSAAVVPHHLFDVLDVTETASVAEFQRQARAAIADCHARDVTPVLVGGSALYVRAVLDRLEFPGTDPEVREQWAAELRDRGPSALHAELARRDPAAAAQILPTNGRRIVRALEVIELTGQPFAATMPPYESIYQDLIMIGLDVPRDVLDVRLAERVDQMWADGFVDEVRRLRAAGHRGRPHGVPCAGLPADPGVPAR